MNRTVHRMLCLGLLCFPTPPRMCKPFSHKLMLANDKPNGADGKKCVRLFNLYARCLFETFFRFYKLQSENIRVLAHSSDSFNFRYNAFHTVCRVGLVEYASPTAGIEGACGLILQLLNGSDTCCSVCVNPPRQHISAENVRYKFLTFM